MESVDIVANPAFDNASCELPEHLLPPEIWHHVARYLDIEAKLAELDLKRAGIAKELEYAEQVTDALVSATGNIIRVSQHLELMRGKIEQSADQIQFGGIETGQALRRLDRVARAIGRLTHDNDELVRSMSRTRRNIDRIARRHIDDTASIEFEYDDDDYWVVML